MVSISLSDRSLYLAKGTQINGTEQAKDQQRARIINNICRAMARRMPIGRPNVLLFDLKIYGFNHDSCFISYMYES